MAQPASCILDDLQPWYLASAYPMHSGQAEQQLHTHCLGLISLLKPPTFLHIHHKIMSLDDDPSVPIGDEKLHLQIITQLWRQTTPSTTLPTDLHWDPYFLYYNAQCNTAIQSGRGLYTTIRTHADVQIVARYIQAPDCKSDIKAHLRRFMRQPRSPKEADDMLEGSVMLVARLLSMTDIGPLPYNPPGTQHSVTWTSPTCTLQELLCAHFTAEEPAASEQDNANDIMFGEDFTAYKLQRYCGVDISWTNNLADHLLLSQGGKKLYVFHHASFLRWQDGVLPDGLAAETLDTLALLFPSYHVKTKEWVVHCTLPSEVDMHILELGRLRDCHASDFKFWRKRLVAVYKVFKSPHQRSIAQQWHDRRDKAQWYTFWVAIVILCLTVFFGLVQSIEGALQVYKAYHPS
jgi:hypothetical protein